MKNLLLVALLLFAAVYASAQSPIFNKDTVTYNGSKLYPGKYIKLNYGANTNKNFVFVWLKEYERPLLSYFCNQLVVIEKIKKADGKYYATGHMRNVTDYPETEVRIDIQAAIDSKEISTEVPNKLE